MRVALLVSPVDPGSSAASSRALALGWMREALARAGFRVHVVSDSENTTARLHEAIARIGREDAVLVHLSGRLGDPFGGAALRVDEGTTIDLRAISNAITARSPAALAFVAELAYAGAADDALAATEHVETIREALDARARGACALVAVHAASSDEDPIAFSRLVLNVAEESAQHGPAFLSDVYERVRSMPESLTAARGCALVRAPDEFELASAKDVPEPAGSAQALPAIEELDEDSYHEAEASIQVTRDAVAQAEATVLEGETVTAAIAKAEPPPEAKLDVHADVEALARADAKADGRADAGADAHADAHAHAHAHADPLPAPAPIADAKTDAPPAPIAAPSHPKPLGADDSRGIQGLVIEEEDDGEAPDLYALVALADAAQLRGEWEHALAGYRAALTITPRANVTLRASLLSRAGACERARGNREASSRAFERAFAMAPKDRGALEGLIDLAAEAGDWTRAVALRRQRFEAITDPVERVDDLFGLARVLVERLRDVSGAITLLEQARAMDATREDVLEALRRANKVAKRWAPFVETTEALAALTRDPKARAKLRLQQARVAIERLEDDDRGIASLEAALRDDPELEEARVLLAAIRGESSQAAPPPRPSSYSEPPPRVSTSGVTRRDMAASDVDSRVTRADELIARGEETAAIAELETAMSQAPWDVAAYERLHALHARAGRIDRAYLAALALEELGSVDADAQATLDKHRPERALRARATLDASAWRALRAPGSDDVVEGIFGAIGRAAVAASLDERRARRAAVSLDPSRRQSDTSTASIVRCFAWASQVLGVATPELYVLDDVPGGIAAVPAAAPSTAIGPGVLSGLSMKELAYLTGRHATYYRPEHQVLVHFPTLNDLTVLLLASVQLVTPGLPVPPSIAQEVNALRTRLAYLAREDERAAAAVAVRGLEARGHRVNLAAWIRSVELTAGRAGLLLAGDLRAAMGRVRAEARAIANVTADDRRADLLSFCASRAHAELRERFAVTDAPGDDPGFAMPASLRAAG
jgi:tetratricopeptide (TPR) repeat protein